MARKTKPTSRPGPDSQALPATARWEDSLIRTVILTHPSRSGAHNDIPCDVLPARGSSCSAENAWPTASAPAAIPESGQSPRPWQKLVCSPGAMPAPQPSHKARIDHPGAGPPDPTTIVRPGGILSSATAPSTRAASRRVPAVNGRGTSSGRSMAPVRLTPPRKHREAVRTAVKAAAWPATVPAASLSILIPRRGCRASACFPEVVATRIDQSCKDAGRFLLDLHCGHHPT